MGEPKENQLPESNSQLSLWSSEPPDPLPPPATGGPSGEWVPLPPPRPAPDPPWTLGDLFSFIVFAFFSFIFANLVAALIFSLLRHELVWKTTMQQAFTQTRWIVAMQTGWEILWLLFIYFIVTAKYHRRFWEALKWVKVRRSAVSYLLGGAALALLVQWLVNMFPSQKHLPIEKLFSSPHSAYLLTFFGICVAPFVEELVFRGFFYPVFERLWGLAVAVLLTALLFAAIHIPQLSGGWLEIGGIFVVGAAFSYVRGKTGSLVPPFLMHLAYNTCLFVSLYFSTDQFRHIKG